MNHDTPARWLTTSQASAWLHVTPKTIRRRIERGELEARKVARDGGGIVWQVCIGGEVDIVTPIKRDTERPSKGQAERVTPSERPIVTDTGKDMGAERNAHEKDSDLTTHLLGEVAFLRAALEQRDRDAAELRAALRAALKLTGDTSAPMLTAGTPETPESDESGAADTDSHGDATVPDGATDARESASISYSSIADELERSLKGENQ